MVEGNSIEQQVAFNGGEQGWDPRKKEAQDNQHIYIFFIYVVHPTKLS